MCLGSAAKTSRQIDSASSGSFTYRYNSAFAIASGIPDFEMVFSFRSRPIRAPCERLRLRRSSDFADNPHQRIVELVHYAFLQRNDRVVRNVDVLRTNLRATFRDVAKPDAQLILQQLRPRDAVHRVHIQPGHAHKKSRPAELLVFVMVSQDVAHVLAAVLIPPKHFEDRVRHQASAICPRPKSASTLPASPEAGPAAVPSQFRRAR